MIFDLDPDLTAVLLFFCAGFFGCMGFRSCDWLIHAVRDLVLDLLDRSDD